MCGRARCALSHEKIEQLTGAKKWENKENYKPTYNAAPGRDLPVLLPGSSTVSRELKTFRWGLIPFFTKKTDKPDYWRMFNARSESVEEKPAFKRLVSSKRCVIVSEGFYEWKQENRGKQPYYIHLSTDEPLYFAGLYDSWTQPDGQILYTYTILTTESSKRLEWLHNRMPVILRTEEERAEWLDTPPHETSKLQKLLASYDGEDLVWHAVTKSMSSLSFQGPECSKELVKPSMETFFKPRKSLKKGEVVNTDETEPMSVEEGEGAKRQHPEDEYPKKASTPSQRTKKLKTTTPPAGQKDISNFFLKQ